MKCIAVIPARGGSKRIPRKNIKSFCEKPIIAYSIEAAIHSELFERVIVSTDDREIAVVAEKFGAEVPFFRSEENANDYAGLADVLLEVDSELLREQGNPESYCCLLPTAPFITPEVLKAAFKKFVDGAYDSLIPMCRYTTPVPRALVQSDSGQVMMKWPENYAKRSQDLEDFFYDAGQFYFITATALTKQKRLYTDKATGLVLDESVVQDIDTMGDWLRAEEKFKQMFG